jgi:hypothetical protein
MDDEERIRELMALIDSEKDPQKVKMLAAELGRLLMVSGKSWPTHEKPRIN